MYELSTGRNPFLGKDRNQTFMKILKFEPQFPEQFFSKRATSLIKALLTKDPVLRPQKVLYLVLFYSGERFEIDRGLNSLCLFFSSV